MLGKNPEWTRRSILGSDWRLRTDSWRQRTLCMTGGHCDNFSSCRSQIPWAPSEAYTWILHTSLQITFKNLESISKSSLLTHQVWRKHCKDVHIYPWTFDVVICDLRTPWYHPGCPLVSTCDGGNPRPSERPLWHQDHNTSLSGIKNCHCLGKSADDFLEFCWIMTRHKRALYSRVSALLFEIKLSDPEQGRINKGFCLISSCVLTECVLILIVDLFTFFCWSHIGFFSKYIPEILVRDVCCVRAFHWSVFRAVSQKLITCISCLWWWCSFGNLSCC